MVAWKHQSGSKLIRGERARPERQMSKQCGQEKVTDVQLLHAVQRLLRSGVGAVDMHVDDGRSHGRLTGDCCPEHPENEDRNGQSHGTSLEWCEVFNCMPW